LNQGPPVRKDESPAFGEAAPRFGDPAVALGRAVAEQRAHAELLTDIGEDVERTLDHVRRLVMIDDRRRPQRSRFCGVEARGGGERLLIERTIEAPPDALENLDE